MGSLSPVHWAIVIVVVLLLFGSKKLPDAARSLGKSMRILKTEVSSLHEDEPAQAATVQAAPAQLQSPVAPAASVDAQAQIDALSKQLADLQQSAKTPDGAHEFTLKGDSVHSATAKLTAGTLATVETRAMAERDQLCHNEETWYPPLTKLDHAMPAYTLANTFAGKELGTTWSMPDKRSSFVGNFHFTGQLFARGIGSVGDAALDAVGDLPP